jgi:hypothetical protein
MLMQLIHKPNVKGSVGEQVLAEIWLGKFERDHVDVIGGKGKVDLLVTPYLNTSINRHGDRISVERKSGAQKYKIKDLDDAVRHAIENGVAYSIIVYDTQENLPQKPMIVIRVLIIRVKK